MKIVEQIDLDYYDIEIDEKYQNAIIGVVERFGEEPSLLYSAEELSKESDVPVDFGEYVITAFITMNEIADAYPENLCYPEFDNDIVGIVDEVGQKPLVLYNKEKVIETIMKGFDGEEDDDPYTDAIEHFEFNVIGGYIGDTTPAFAVIYE